MKCRIYKEGMFYYGQVYNKWPVGIESFRTVTVGHLTKNGAMKAIKRYKKKQIKKFYSEEFDI